MILLCGKNRKSALGPYGKSVTDVLAFGGLLLHKLTATGNKNQFLNMDNSDNP